MASKKRRQFSNEEKVAILKRHLVNGERVSDICDELKLNPNMFYRWQKTFFENGAKAFESIRSSQQGKHQREMNQLQGKIVLKDSVISELVTELIKAKKNIGEL